MKIESYVEPLSGLTRLRDAESKLCFTRIVAGLCWPKLVTPGAIVALAEDARADAIDGIRVLHLVEYVAEADVEQLLELASQIAPLADDSLGRSAVSVWVGNPWHPFHSRLRPFNARLTQEARPRIHLRPAPGIGKGWQVLEDWLPYLQRRIVGRAALLLKNRDLIAKIEDAGRDVRRKIEDFPAVAALVWAIAYCDERAAMQRQPKEQSENSGNVAGY